MNLVLRKGIGYRSYIGLNHFCFADKKRSFYQILDIETKFTQRELRKKYLIKARKFHPDHNQEPGATEEFKLIKEAYQTLKDPQKKLMYDSGVSQTPEDVTPVHDNEMTQGKKYYENKWYGYRRPNDKDIRDEYYQMKADYFSQKPVIPLRSIFSFTFVVLSLFVYDFFLRYQGKKQKDMKSAREVLGNAARPEDKQNRRQRLLRGYVERRQKLHKVDI